MDMKWLILLGLVLLVIGFVVARYRRQIQMGWQVLMMFRKMRQAAKPKETPIEKQGSLKDVPLVPCEKCGKWVDPENALKLRANNFYCSSICMEKAAKLQSLVD